MSGDRKRKNGTGGQEEAAIVQGFFEKDYRRDLRRAGIK